MGIEQYGMRVMGIYPNTISDGEGLRYSIYLAGCTHRCPKCHNPQSWDRRAGVLLDEEKLSDMVNAIREDSLLDGITISGGDPFFNPLGLAEFLRRITEATSLPVWCYTGYTIEEISARRALQAPLPYIDVLVDGRYVDELSDPTILFRGSSNQRLIQNPAAYLERIRMGQPEGSGKS